MAQVTRKRILVNPARRKRARVNAHRRRKLSDKQIRIFGTPAQKAALKRKHSRKRTRTNPTRRRSLAARKLHRAAPRRRSARRSNPGEIITLALNPARKRRSTKVARKRRRSSARRHHRRTRRAVMSNPAPVRRYRRRRHAVVSRRRHARRNPSTRGVTGLLMQGVFAAGGFIGSRAITQAVLQGSNTGYVGYAGNLVATFILGKLADMVKKGSSGPVMIGGALGVVARVLTDNTSLGSQLSKYGMGDYVMQQTVIPPTLVPGGGVGYRNPFPPPAPAVVAAKAGMSGLPLGKSSLVRQQ